MTATSNVNYVRHLNAAMAHFDNNGRLHSSHISLYVALFNTWNDWHFPDIFPIKREAIKRLSHIRSSHTYSKCIKELHNAGYIIYSPGTDIFMPALISINRFGETGELMAPDRVIFDTRAVSKNSTGTDVKNSMHTGAENDTSPVSKMQLLNKQSLNNFKRERLDGPAHTKKNIKEIPTLEEVKSYFLLAGFPEKEARKFFFHYQAVGWIISGSPIRDWHAAAEKWNENTALLTKKQSDNGTSKPGRLHVNQNKRYDIPL